MNRLRAMRVAVAFAAMALAAPVLAQGPSSEAPARPISSAEQKIFLDDHLAGVGGARVLRYHYSQTGSLDAAYDGPVVLTVSAGSDDSRAVDVAYLDGPRKVMLPPVANAHANPVILYFLEQDVRAMHRRLGGSENYFRRRIRLAFADGAELRPTSLMVDGKAVQATEVVIRPFVGDPMKDKLGRFEDKSYAFALSDRVPGQVVRLRSLVTDRASPGDPAADRKRPLLEEVLMFESAQ